MSEATAALQIAGFSDIGPVRMENQDSWRALELGGGRVALLLADGMGGHKGGREAAQGAVDAAVAALEAAGQTPDLTAAVAAANDAVRELALRIGGRPGTTLVAAVIAGEEVTVANVGDSRAYLVAGDTAVRLTEDHSWVAEQVRLGAIAPDELRHHFNRNVITRAVMGETVAPDLFRNRLAAGQTLLLCSDGLWEPLDEDQIASLLAGGEPLARRVERLCLAALDAGGTDNVTAVAAQSCPAG